jgi:hypothetical protein
MAVTPAIATCEAAPGEPSRDTEALSRAESPTSSSTQASLDRKRDREFRLEGVWLRESTVTHSPVLSYVRMVVGLMERIRLSRTELVAILCRALRQHSFAFRKRIDYVLAFLHRHPP